MLCSAKTHEQQNCRFVATKTCRYCEQPFCHRHVTTQHGEPTCRACGQSSARPDHRDREISELRALARSLADMAEQSTGPGLALEILRQYRTGIDAINHLTWESK